MAFLTVAIFSLGFFQTRRELEYDEELLTASDFSIKVDNPPPDAVDPDGACVYDPFDCLFVFTILCSHICVAVISR
jgi:hypothetical protein